MHLHFIAIGGAIMHQLAIALQHKGFTVSGSDDEITDPAKTNLLREQLLPEAFGWFPEKITKDLDGIILGMHAKADNPELLKAQELGIPVYSFPEYIYEASKDKQRVVIAGSHGKTTTTSMIMHVLGNFYQCIPASGMPVTYETGCKWQDVVAARISILARNSERSSGYTDDRTYNLGLWGVTTATSDNYKRHVFSGVVKVNNVGMTRECMPTSLEPC